VFQRASILIYRVLKIGKEHGEILLEELLLTLSKNYASMKTPAEIFKSQPELLQNPVVQELVSEYDGVCDALIDLHQLTEMGKEKYLRILLREIRESIAMELHRDLEAERFGETERVDFKRAVQNLQEYIGDYCREYQIYL
jgi:hypothetical protein